MTAHKGPILAEAECRFCRHYWTAFLPDGWIEGSGLECPRCGLMTGDFLEDV